LILVVDRDPSRGTSLAAHLAREGFTASSSLTPPEPGEGVAVAVVCVTSEAELAWVRHLRAATGAVRVLALTPDHLRVSAFEHGADDVTQLAPLSAREVTLRARSLWRRPAPDVAAPRELTQPEWLRADDRSVRVREQWVQLSDVEFGLLRALAVRAGHAISRERLVEQVWDAGTQLRTVDSTVKRLRLRLGEPGTAIETVRGLGYRFNPERFGAS
jgi:DNA-binding response OmpR family regulator